MILRAQSTTKDYIRAKNKLQSITQPFSIHFIESHFFYYDVTTLLKKFHKKINTQFLPSSPPPEKPVHSINYKYICNHYNVQQQSCFGTCLHSVGTQHGNLYQSSVATSRLTYFILQADTGTRVSHSQHWKNSGEVLEEMKVNGPGRYTLVQGRNHCQ